MENNKRSAEEALNGSTSSRQRPRRQEDASWGAPIASDQRANSAQPLGSSLASIRRPLPRHSRRQISNNDLLASIDRTDQHLANCLSLAESALAMIEDRSPPEISLMRERLARAEARIMGKMSAIISLFFFLDFVLKISDHSFLEYFRFNRSVGESSISHGSCSRICECQGHRSGGSLARHPESCQGGRPSWSSSWSRHGVGCCTSPFGS